MKPREHGLFREEYSRFDFCPWIGFSLTIDGLSPTPLLADDMAKILLLAIAIWLLYTVVKRYLGSVASSEQPPAAEDIVPCAHCGVHLPRSDSIAVDQRHYCGEACREAYRREHQA